MHRLKPKEPKDHVMSADSLILILPALRLLLLLTKRCEGAYGAGVPAALPAGLPAAALTHTGPRDTTASS